MVCPKGCGSKINSFPYVTVAEKDLQMNLGDVKADHFVLAGATCMNEDCEEFQENKIHSVGK